MTSVKDLRGYVKDRHGGKDFFTDPRITVTRLPTGVYQLDDLLDGGLKEGSVVEFFGAPASGKTYMMNNIIAQAQKLHPEKSVLYLDYEISFDSERAEDLGVDVDKLLYAQPVTMEDGYNAIIDMLDSDEELSLIVIDSVSAMPPDREEEKDIGDSTVALQAMTNTQAMRKLAARLNKNKTTLLYTNQVRDNLSGRGPTYKTSGGNALKHQCNTRLLFERKKDPDVKQADGYQEHKFQMNVKLEKHRGSGERHSCTLYYIFREKGIDRLHDVTTYLQAKGVIETAGAWLKVSGVEKKLQGKSALYKYLQDNPSEVDRLVREAKGEEVEE